MQTSFCITLFVADLTGNAKIQLSVCVFFVLYDEKSK